MVVALYVYERSGTPLQWLDRAALMSSNDEFEQFFLAHYEAVLSVLVLKLHRFVGHLITRETV